MPTDWKVKIAQLTLKNWWKIILILVVVGLVLSGYKFNIGPFGCEKEPIKVMEKAK